MIAAALVIVVVVLPFVAGLGLVVWGLATKGRDGIAGWTATACGAAVFALWSFAFIVNRILLAIVRAVLHMPQFDGSLSAQRVLYVVAYSAFLVLGLTLSFRSAGVTTVLTRLLPASVSDHVRDEASTITTSRCLRLLGIWSLFMFALLVAGAFGLLFAG